ncbi:hypothetical protein HYH03_005606 [Edaphochlamys debaryana]|uniref:Uncharacterized protein n=1 Tax=Edaphochlamys debaryana TaxID=47281 RepID=A0A836C274_9CHLO|nr:hypothetical protein HYH03_005606 [Edaphochlamys debaryana]|eukprot:KAG2496378.1 hypothetical protein HYH03_005606 [Edaphochlamys debaryana]
MGKVLVDAFGTLKPNQPEIAVLLNTSPPTALPDAATQAAVLESFPTAEGLARLAMNRWSRSSGLSGYQEILNAFIKLHVSEASVDLKPAAKEFLSNFRTRVLQLVKESLAEFGNVNGPCYDEVYGENADKSQIPKYLPVVSHFQLHFHDIANDKALFAAWADCVTACGASLPQTSEPGLGNSPSRRALVYMLSMAEDIAFVRLAQVLLSQSCEFEFE